MRISEIFVSYRKSELRNTMVTSDLRPEVEILPFCARKMKNMQYNRYYRNSSVIVDLAIGQIPRSTERISSLFVKTSVKYKNPKKISVTWC